MGISIKDGINVTRKDKEMLMHLILMSLSLFMSFLHPHPNLMGI